MPRSVTRRGQHGGLLLLDHGGDGERVRLSGGIDANNTATGGSATDTFTGLVAPTSFIGATPSSGGTTFDAGSEADSFTGKVSRGIR